MSKQRVFKIWMPAVALVLLPLFKAVVVGAAPAAAPMMGFTPTPTVWLVTRTVSLECEPSIRKQASVDVADLGDEVVFTIRVQNDGDRATVKAHVVDIVPDDFEILAGGVTVQPENQVHEVPIADAPEMDVNPKVDGQQVTVYLKPLSHGDAVTIVIRTRRRAVTDAFTCVDNVAWFYTDNCGDPLALMPVCGESIPSHTWWTLAGGLATSALVVSLALGRKRWSG